MKKRLIDFSQPQMTDAAKVFHSEIIKTKAYDSANTYSQYDTCVSGGIVYYSKINSNTGNTPAINANWGLIGDLITGAANQNLTENGYQKLPGGLIVQWGEVIESTTATDYKTFPIVFPNACLSATLSVNSSSPGGVGSNVGTVIKIIDNTKFIWTAGGSYAGGGVAYIIAIGY
jgi:hypothetical protein